MNCRELERLLAEGKPLTAEARKHIDACPGCRALLAAFEEPGPLFDLDRVQGTMQSVTTQLSAVRPLPSDNILILIGFCVFVLFSLMIGGVVGLQGYRSLTPLERTIYYGPILFFGLLFSTAIATAAIPGARQRVRGWQVVVSSAVALAWIVSALFPSFALEHFVNRGFPCLRFGCGCAAGFGIIAASFLRRGYVTRLAPTALLVGSFAGFSGVAALSLHCAIQNAAHIIVWHLGAVAVSAVIGYAIGSALEQQRDS